MLLPPLFIITPKMKLLHILNPAMKRAGTLIALLFLFSFNAWSADTLKPFIMVSSEASDFNSTVVETKSKLESGGFTLAGEHSPYDDTHLLIVTSDELKTAASKSEFGGYAAVIRVAITKNGDQVEVSYSNPVYWANAYRLEDDLSAVAETMTDALGKGEPFGSENGLTVKKLRKYHYTAFMPYFDDPHTLGEFDSHTEALVKINENLAGGKSGIRKIYDIKVPGKEETLIGISMSEGVAADKIIMDKIDVHGKRHSAHLPYEILVSGNKAYALSGKFRIALSFPDLSMMGKGSFMEIMDAPPAIKESLVSLAK